MRVETDHASRVEAYIVHSDSGSTYRVTTCSHDGDPECMSVWRCDCPAGRRGRDCKHLTAAIACSHESLEYYERHRRGPQPTAWEVAMGDTFRVTPVAFSVS